MKRILVTTFYPEARPERREELVETIDANLASELFDTVVLLNEGNAAPFNASSGRLVVDVIDARPTFADLFSAASRVAEPGDIVAIANTDIKFDASICALDASLGPDRCAALSRWEMPAGEGRARLNDSNCTQDTWIFQAPLHAIAADFGPGVPRCDNRLVVVLREAGYAVINPSFSIRTFHMHAGAPQAYGETLPHYVQGPYAYIWPHNLYGPIRTLIHDARRPSARLGYRLDRRRLRRSLLGRALNLLLRKRDAWWGFHAEPVE